MMTDLIFQFHNVFGKNLIYENKSATVDWELMIGTYLCIK